MFIIAHCCSCSTPFYLLFSEISNQATLKPPGFEHGNLDRPKQGMLIPNMFCTFVQRPHHNLVPFSALQNNDLSCGLLESIHTTTMLIYPNFQGSNLIAFKSSKIIVVMILEPSTGTPGGDSRHLDLEGMPSMHVIPGLITCNLSNSSLAGSLCHPRPELTQAYICQKICHMKFTSANVRARALAKICAKQCPEIYQNSCCKYIGIMCHNLDVLVGTCQGFLVSNSTKPFHVCLRKDPNKYQPGHRHQCSKMLGNV